MAQQILQINFKFNVPREQYDSMCSSLAEQFAAIPGCVWKLWIMNENAKEAGGIYLFADEASLESYKRSPLAASVVAHPALSDFSIKQFEVMTEVSRVTRAPLAATAAAA